MSDVHTCNMSFHVRLRGEENVGFWVREIAAYTLVEVQFDNFIFIRMDITFSTYGYFQFCEGLTSISLNRNMIVL